MDNLAWTSTDQKINLKPGKHFRLPDFPGEQLSPRLFTTTYFDTADFRLTRLGVTIGQRVERRRKFWELTLPNSRCELAVPSHQAKPPEPFYDLLFGQLRKQPLHPVTKLRIRRSIIRVQPMDLPVADVFIDKLTILQGRQSAGELRDIWIHPLSWKEKELSAVERTLRDSGAQDGDPRPTVFQALNLDFANSPKTLSPTAPTTEHVKAILQIQVRVILRHDPGTRLGKDPEELHHMRVGVRRFRTLLRSAGALFAPDWAASLQADLKRLSSILGTLRDQDILLKGLQTESELLEPEERKHFDLLLSDLDHQRTGSRAQLKEALHSEWYLDLLSRLDEAAQHPNFNGARDISLKSVAEKELKKFAKFLKAKHKSYSDQELHQLRRRTKRVRYVTEFALGTIGKPAMHFVRQAKRVQDILGQHQDAVITEERLRDLLNNTKDIHAAFATGRIIERLQTRKHQTRELFPHAWAKLKKRGGEAFAPGHSK